VDPSILIKPTQSKVAAVVAVGMAAVLDRTAVALAAADLAMSAEFLMSLISLEIIQLQIQMDLLPPDVKDLGTQESLIHYLFQPRFNRMHSLDRSPREYL
jgi:hypothetical protein